MSKNEKGKIKPVKPVKSPTKPIVKPEDDPNSGPGTGVPPPHHPSS